MNWIESAAKIIAIILDKTNKIFLEINFSDLIIIKNKIQVIDKTRNKEKICEILYIKFPDVELLETITEVMAAGPASRGIARGKTDVVIDFDETDFSLRADLLSNNISMAISNNIMPPAILNEYKEIFKWLIIDFPIIKKNNKIKNARKEASTAILYLFSLIFCNKVRNIATVPSGSITTK